MNKHLNCILGNLLCDGGFGIYNSFFDHQNLDVHSYFMMSFALSTPFNFLFTTVDHYIHPYITVDKTFQYVLLVTENLGISNLIFKDDFKYILPLNIVIKSLLTKYCLDSDAETEKLQCAEFDESFNDLLENDHTIESFID